MSLSEGVARGSKGREGDGKVGKSDDRLNEEGECETAGRANGFDRLAGDWAGTAVISGRLTTAEADEDEDDAGGREGRRVVMPYHRFIGPRVVGRSAVSRKRRRKMTGPKTRRVREFRPSVMGLAIRDELFNLARPEIRE